MTPADIAALLRIKQAREQRMRGALDGARRAGQQAEAARSAAEDARERFAAEAQEKRHGTYERLEAADSVGVWPLQACAADLAALRSQEARMAGQVRRAAAAESDSRSALAAAARQHGAAQRGVEAFQELSQSLRLLRDAAADRAEEAETEEPRRGRPA